MKKFLEEFKQFAMKGDVISLAVGIIIGSAFTAIVKSLVNDIITPILGLVIGGIDFTNLTINFKNASIAYGNFIQSIIMFILTAFVLFVIIRRINKFKEMIDKKEEEKKVVELSSEEKLLTEIRDLLKK